MTASESRQSRSDKNHIAQYYFHNMRKLCQENENLQFVFCSGRSDAQDKCRIILEQGKELQKTDIHYNFKKYDILPTEL